MSAYYHAAPCTRLAGDPAPGVRLMRGDREPVLGGGLLGRLSPQEARDLGEDLILCAYASEAQWDSSLDEATS